MEKAEAENLDVEVEQMDEKELGLIAREKIIVALDVNDCGHALSLVDTLGDLADFYKIGLELFTSGGPAVVWEMKLRGKRVFLDLKVGGIPRTVERAVRAAADLGVDFLSVDADAEVVVPAANAVGKSNLKVLAVIALTSRRSMNMVDFMRRVETAWQGGEYGAHGFIMGGLWAKPVREGFGRKPLIVCPGIRRILERRHGHQQVCAPGDAIRGGADYLVVGRPIVEALDPCLSMMSFTSEVKMALEDMQHDC